MSNHNLKISSKEAIAAERARMQQREQERIRQEYAKTNPYDKLGNSVALLQQPGSGLTPAKQRTRPRAPSQYPPSGGSRSLGLNTPDKRFLREQWKKENPEHGHATRIQAFYRGRATRAKQLLSKLRDLRREEEEIIGEIVMDQQQKEEEERRDYEQVANVLSKQTPKKRGYRLEYKPTLKF